jgi:hypothetical protein
MAGLSNRVNKRVLKNGKTLSSGFSTFSETSIRRNVCLVGMERPI